MEQCERAAFSSTKTDRNKNGAVWKKPERIGFLFYWFSFEIENRQKKVAAFENLQHQEYLTNFKFE